MLALTSLWLKPILSLQVYMVSAVYPVLSGVNWLLSEVELSEMA